jgi:hypothetical protein
MEEQLKKIATQQNDVVTPSKGRFVILSEAKDLNVHASSN